MDGELYGIMKKYFGKKFKDGVEKNDFMYDEQLGCYKKMIDQDTYFILPNQSMPECFDFSTHFHATFLDYYDEVNGESIFPCPKQERKK